LEIIQMNLEHVTGFTAAMQRKELELMLQQMTDDVVLHTPLAAEPVSGKAAIREVVSPLLYVVDAFDFRETMQGPEHVSRFSTSRSGQSSWTVWIIGSSTARG
jgi:hypothetical protein